MQHSSTATIALDTLINNQHPCVKQSQTRDGQAMNTKTD